MAEQLDRKRRLAGCVAPYWAGEAEVARAHFARDLPIDGHFGWLRAQAYKEARVVRELPEDQRQELVRTGSLPRSALDPMTRRTIEQEFSHFALLAGLLRDFGGEPISVDDRIDLPADRELQEARARHRARGVLEAAVAAFTEGGGGAMYAALGDLDGDVFRRRVAAAFQAIYDDELEHGPAAIHAIERLATDGAAWQRAERIATELSWNRLLMRNEMFGHPLAEARLREIAGGRIEPWPYPIPL